MTSSTTVSSTAEVTLDQVLREGLVRAVYQPVVDLQTGGVVGYEALARGPEGSALERPDLLFAAARRSGRLAELDWACRAAALRGALDAGMAPPLTLFVNVEPDVLDAPPPPELVGLVEEARQRLSVVVECTERALTDRPAELLQSIATLRRQGFGIAIDDVGAVRSSLALMPFLQADVVKLDLRLVQQRATVEIAEIVSAVNAEVERTGALLLAEGIETEEHVAAARAMGASLGQGYLFGRPGPLPSVLPTSTTALPRHQGVTAAAALPTPFGVAAGSRQLRTADKRLLIRLSTLLERQALALGGAAVVLSAFQSVEFFTRRTARHYVELARQAAFVGVFGVGMHPAPAPGVRGAVLAEEDPVRGEWDIAVVGPHFAAALVARDLGDEGPDADRRFEFVLTYDRDLVVRVAGSLMCRIWPGVAEAELLAAATADEAPASPTAPPRRALPTWVPGPTGVPGATDAHLRDRALAASTNGVTIADMRLDDSPLVYANPGFERLTGFSVEEVLGRNCRFLQVPGTDPAAVEEMAKAMREGREASVTLLNGRKDGSTWWNEILLSPIRDDGGRIVQYVGVQNDVTARVEAERALREQSARTAGYLDVAGTMLMVVGPGGLVERLNRKGTEVLGYEEDELLGRSVLDLLPDDEARERARQRALELRAGTLPAGSIEAEILTADGRRRLISWQNTLLHADDGTVLATICSGEDVTERRAAESRIAHLAYHDSLTDLPNRAMLVARLEEALDEARRSGTGMALLFVDLDDFKAVNDSFGHAAGDELLRQVARRLAPVLGPGELLARQGGDEFLVLLNGEVDPRARAEAVSEALEAAMVESFELVGTTLVVGASTGIATFPDQATDAEGLLGRADAAMYRAKAEGGRHHHFAADHPGASTEG